MNSLFKKPSAWGPILMSLSALAMFFGFFIASHGVIQREEDEGVAAHLFQLLMGGQVFIILYFLGRYLPEKPREVAMVFALQILAGLAACFPVWYFQL